MPTNPLISDGAERVAIATQANPRRLVLPSISQATDATTIAAWNATALENVSGQGGVAAGYAIVPIEGGNYFGFKPFFQGADAATYTVDAFVLSWVDQNQAGNGGRWMVSYAGSFALVNGSVAVPSSLSGITSGTTAKWADDVTVTSVVPTPPGMLQVPSTPINDTPLSFAFDVQGAGFVLLRLPSGSNAVCWTY